MKRRMLLLLPALGCALPVVADSVDDRISAIVDGANTPPGVVFEIVSGDEAMLVSEIPRVRRLSERLRARFPGLDIAVVTHGSEQFSLLRSEAGAYRDLHAQIRALTGEESVEVHVCGTHASWRGNVADDFPDYVDVAVAAPAKINDYRNLGYVVILL